MFAIITPALITGAVAGRMKFKSLCVFIILWSLMVYYPLAHMVWADGGVLADLCFADTKLSVKIPAIGSYMVSNALAAVAVGKLCGLNDEQLIKGVEA